MAKRVLSGVMPGNIFLLASTLKEPRPFNNCDLTIRSNNYLISERLYRIHQIKSFICIKTKA